MSPEVWTPPLVGRLAPSPTGVLHLGNARSFLLAWLSVRSRGGRMILRIEDIDGPRTKPGADRAAIEDLEWLGLDWDEGPFYQSNRLDVYETAARELEDAGLAFPCVCSRKDVEEASRAPHGSSQDGPVYPGTCRGLFRDRNEARRKTGREAALRFRVTRDEFPFHDLVRGSEAGRLNGDFVITKRDGLPAYQLAVVVDDAAQGVTEVLRGDDLVPSTPRQLLLYEALRLSPPRFAHVPLMVGRDGRRLAKRHGDTSLAHFRRAGVAADEVLGYLAYSAGLRNDRKPVVARDLLDGFRLDLLRTEPWAVAADPFVPPRS